MLKAAVSVMRLGLAGLILALWGSASRAEAGHTFLVLGVIASEQHSQGVALLKAVAGGETFAARIGQEIGPQIFVAEITRQIVVLKVRGEALAVRVGDEVDTTNPKDAAPNAGLNNGLGPLGAGIERAGNVVKISTSLRQELTHGQLPHILNQAAAVPYYVNGELAGFRLLEIDPGSIYDKVGFLNGDVVTALNGQKLSDVAMTIRLLQSLKDEMMADVTFLRSGAEQSVHLVVQ